MNTIEFKLLTDDELKSWMQEAHKNISQLMDDIRPYAFDLRRIDRYELIEIRDRYAILKAEIKAAAKYSSLAINSHGAEFYESVFKRNLHEASAFGFSAKIGSSDLKKIWSSLEEARYKLSKNFPGIFPDKHS